jgi:hypothetical protein
MSKERTLAVLFGIPPKSVTDQFKREQDKVNAEYEALKASGASWWTRFIFCLKNK